MTTCVDMKVGQIYVCPECGVELQVVKACGESDHPSCGPEECKLMCCDQEMQLSTGGPPCGACADAEAMNVGDKVRVVSLCDDRELCYHEFVGRQGTVANIAFGPDRWPIRVAFADGETRDFEPEELELL